MNSYSIDINADVGEGFGNESKLMPYLSSCNIACGGHSGDVVTMRDVVKLAKRHNVKIGAHPSFPDKENFGRTIMDISAADLYSSLRAQVRALQNVIYEENEQLHHIKPHGALYNLVAKDNRAAQIVIEVFKSLALPVALYAPYGSVISELAQKENLKVIYEAFVDRNYNDDLSLVSRKSDKAILTDKEAVLNHVLNMIKNQKVMTLNGVEVPIKASTFCVHGDTKNAQKILRFLNKELPKHKIQIQ